MANRAAFSGAATVFSGAAEVILDQAENDSFTFTLKLLPPTPKYLIFILVWSSAALC